MTAVELPCLFGFSLSASVKISFSVLPGFSINNMAAYLQRNLAYLPGSTPRFVQPPTPSATIIILWSVLTDKPSSPPLNLFSKCGLFEQPTLKKGTCSFLSQNEDCYTETSPVAPMAEAMKFLALIFIID